ncbi:MAG: cation:proton antiporter [Salinisphaera sp.]|nr:cation:proton antiporter [Salinisphaera sp.]
MELTLSVALILIVFLGVLSQWVGWWLRIPAIVLFVVSGILAGPVLGLVNPSEDFGVMLRPLVGLAVAVILFESSLSLHLHEFKEAARGVSRLISLGGALTWLLCTLAAWTIGGLSFPVSLLLGSILIVTGPTVIIPMLRHAGLNRRTASYLKWEGIINDPIGALLGVLIFQYFVLTAGGVGGAVVILDLALALLCAGALGVGAAWLVKWSFNRSLVPEYLKAPVTIAVVLAIYGGANQVFAEAGLLAVTVMGMVMGNMSIAGMGELRRFKEYITVLMVAMVFVVLTADLDPQVLQHLDWHAAGLVLAVVFLVRPASVLLATAYSGMDWRDRALVAWIAPRGIVASVVAGVFGPGMVAAGYGDARMILPVIFAVVFVTVVLHGFSLGWLARRMGLAARPHGVLIVGASPWTTELARMLTKELDAGVLLVDSSWHRLRGARLAGVRVLYGEVLSDEVDQSLELNEIACLLAATSNDAYNALVCNAFAKHLEHDRVFQLPMYAAEENSSAKLVAEPLRGRPAFHADAQYEELWRRHYQGWQFSRTRITDTYTYDDFRAGLAGDAFVIAVLRGDGTLLFRPADKAGAPSSGDTLVYYSRKESSEQQSARGKPPATAQDPLQPEPAS